jgi:hypothetical protein
MSGRKTATRFDVRLVDGTKTAVRYGTVRRATQRKCDHHDVHGNTDCFNLHMCWSVRD